MVFILKSCFRKWNIYDFITLINIPLTRPPIILVKTWCQLLRCEDEEAREHAKIMLFGVFGDIRGVVKFVKANKIKVGW
jgi:hypothetical protein